MANDRTRGDENVRRDPLSNDMERNSSVPNDLPDSPEDQKELEQKETTIDLPDVKDIPGQEFVNAPVLGEMADTTISSDGEEGRRVFDDDTDTGGDDFNVRPDERHTLERTDALPTRDEDNLERASLDSVDFQGEALNEKGFGEELGDTVSDDDLDTNTEGDETAMSESDEENKSFSLGGDDNDNNESRPSV